MKVNKVEISGYNNVKKTYKLTIDITQQSIGKADVDTQKILSLTWKNIKKGLEKIKQKLNPTMYKKLIYDLENKFYVLDSKYRNAQEFINGRPLKKNVRKISDVQNFFDVLLELQPDNSVTIDCVFENIFKNL